MVGPQNILLNLHYAIPLPSQLGVRGGSWEWGRDPWPKRGSGHPKACPHKWWGPQNIPLDVHYPYLWSIHQEWGEPVVREESKPWPNRGGGHPKLAPQVVGTPKHTPQYPLSPTSAQSIGSKLGASWGPREVPGTQGGSGSKGERGEWAGSKGSKLGAFWGPRKVPGTKGCSEGKGSKLGARGASWELGEQAWGFLRPQKGSRDPGMLNGQAGSKRSKLGARGASWELGEQAGGFLRSQ